MKISALIIAMCILAGVTAPAATTYYVATDGDDTAHTGIDYWTNAFLTIGKAVTTAAADSGDIVVVSNGEYKTTAYINLSKGVTLTNFSGNPADTIINAQEGGWRCLYVSHPNARVSGFTIINGRYNYAAGVYVNTGVVENCIISSNIAGSSGGAGCFLTGIATMRWCVVSGNTATNAQDAGGGCKMSGANTWLINCRISGNVVSNRLDAVMRGGGIDVYSGGWIIGCTVEVNYCEAFGGGMLVRNSGNLTIISNCVFRGNSATHGGGIYSGPNTYIYNTIVESNYSSGSYAGAIVAGTNIVLDRLIVRRNFAVGGYGGIRIDTPNNIVLQNSLLEANTAGYYGGLAINSLTGRVSNCTIVGNVMTNLGGTYSAGAAFLTPDANARIENCVVWSNYNQNESGYNEIIYTRLAGTITSVFNCCSMINEVSPADLLDATHGNITNHPAFYDYAGGNYRLVKGSPCINTGVNRDWTTNSFDLDNRARIRYGTVDMGAYEQIHDATVYRAW